MSKEENIGWLKNLQKGRFTDAVFAEKEKSFLAVKDKGYILKKLLFAVGF